MAYVEEPLLGRYELHELLGRGGMGVVHAGFDRVLRRRVAIKVLPAWTGGDSSAVRRFEREALAAAALSHPNIVAVYDTGRDETTRFIVMERVDGENLAQLIAGRGPLPVEEAVGLAAQVAAALGAAHAAGIVHRDIKPANVMVDVHGAAKVLDFGIARAQTTTHLTATSQVLGSAAYMAPEVARGERADARADIYALGCVLYELLTGRPPFEGELPASLLHQHASRRPQPLRALRPDAPEALERLLAATLAKDPADRPQRARELRVALLRSVSPSQPALPSRFTRRSGRDRAASNRFERVGIGIAALLVTIGLAMTAASAGSGSGGAGVRTRAAGRASAGELSARDAAKQVGRRLSLVFTRLESTAGAIAEPVETAPANAPALQPIDPRSQAEASGSHGDGPGGHDNGRGPGDQGPPGHDHPGPGPHGHGHGGG